MLPAALEEVVDLTAERGHAIARVITLRRQRRQNIGEPFGFGPTQAGVGSGQLRTRLGHRPVEERPSGQFASAARILRIKNDRRRRRGHGFRCRCWRCRWRRNGQRRGEGGGNGARRYDRHRRGWFGADNDDCGAPEPDRSARGGRENQGERRNQPYSAAAQATRAVACTGRGVVEVHEMSIRGPSIAPSCQELVMTP